MKDFPKPNVENTDNYREASRLSQKFKEYKGQSTSKTVAIMGGKAPSKTQSSALGLAP